MTTRASELHSREAPPPDEGKLVGRLAIWPDEIHRESGATQMALDEALLLTADQPVIRFYTWARPEITFGFFTPLDAVSDQSQPSTRRWTGGGVVEHGNDVTFSLAIPRAALPSGLRAGESYRIIHEALAGALRQAGFVGAEAVPTVDSRAEARGLGVSPGACFAKPVSWDLIDRDSGLKIAGGAQRRSRKGLLHQGSVRLPAELRSVRHRWTRTFSESLAGECLDFPHAEEAERLADELRRDRYQSRAWQQRF
ncbi:MAG: hypothetical protein KDN19_07185 [Verrucomicrobiae bacterium]|nr:hypothetical protein [Verrucomicrobiae bacterium]